MLHSIDPDQHGPLGEEMASAVSTCVHCGFCLAACPTYQELGQETASPRGRIVMMKEVLENNLSIDDAMPHIDPCLGCLACEPACPSGVPYRDLISPFRALVEPKRKRGWGDRFRRSLAQFTLPYPGRFRAAAMSGKLAKPFAFLVPSSLRVMLDLLPDSLPPKQTWAAVNPAVGTRRARVALLTGCAQSVLDPDINTATIDVLTRNGVEVVVPASQGCCGALSWHVGNQDAAQSFAKKNLDAFPDDVDAIVTNAAGCGSGMHEYHLIMKGTPDQDRAESFRHRVVDVSAFLIQLGDLVPIADQRTSNAQQSNDSQQSGSAATLKVAYHDACHLANAQGVRVQPRELLQMIPGVEVIEIAEGHLCCGSAGTYNIEQPEIATSLGQQKAANVIATGAQVVASGNIGCMTQLAIHLRQAGSSIEVKHTMQVLRDAYQSAR
ncbi:Lactate utilization protein A [Rubripirellula lacrimiformis]|uniref:Glycolate oxidase iron-sulfur subunit n=1 Tax=Rubripirellula lacrimiformis TaxID=1930273 RepID=A0A517NFD5_9BACT|nr:heterodisulfide reductase-related iron-sulfur binding cluster [Rubripirellula lacrimiformis]QDT05842.1 Lactate utilization protein A [Rubripirellula lacrimiformis]